MWRQLLTRVRALFSHDRGRPELVACSTKLVRALKRHLAYATATNGADSRYDVIIEYDRAFKRFESAATWRMQTATGPISPLPVPPRHMPWLKPLYDLWYMQAGYSIDSGIEEGRAALVEFSETCAVLQQRFRVAPAAADALAALLSGVSSGPDAYAHVLVSKADRFSSIVDALGLGGWMADPVASLLETATRVGIFDLPDGIELSAGHALASSRLWPSVDRCVSLCQLDMRGADGAFAVLRRLLVGLPEHAFSNLSLARTTLLLQVAVSNTFDVFAHVRDAPAKDYYCRIVHDVFDLEVHEYAVLHSRLRSISQAQRLEVRAAAPAAVLQLQLIASDASRSIPLCAVSASATEYTCCTPPINTSHTCDSEHDSGLESYTGTLAASQRTTCSNCTSALSDTSVGKLSSALPEEFARGGKTES